jgi:hypothetical protein
MNFSRVSDEWLSIVQNFNERMSFRFRNLAFLLLIEICVDSQIIHHDNIRFHIHCDILDICVHISDEFSVNFLKVRLHHTEVVWNFLENISSI